MQLWLIALYSCCFFIEKKMIIFFHSNPLLFLSITNGLLFIFLFNVFHIPQKGLF